MTKEEAKALKKASKQKIKVDFERTNAWERFRLKFLTFNFFRTVVMKVFRLVLLLVDGVPVVHLVEATTLFFQLVSFSIFSSFEAISVSSQTKSYFAYAGNHRQICQRLPDSITQRSAVFHNKV